METHFATLWENISDVIPDRKALICGNIERTWREYDDRAARLATLLSKNGLGDDSKVGLIFTILMNISKPNIPFSKLKGFL